jgi:hypothetical protein
MAQHKVPLKRALHILLPALFLCTAAQGQNHFGTPVVNSIIQNAIAACSLDSMQKWVKELSGVTPVTIGGAPVSITSRYSGSTPFLQAAGYISGVFSRYGLSPVLENNNAPYNKVNVIGTLQGRRNAYIIISGHFDSASPGCPGADDNASGVAAVLEAARVLHSIGFDYTIKFVAFGGEEQGLKGSTAYAGSHSNDSIVAVINCDMIMWDGNGNGAIQIHSVSNTGTAWSSDLADYVMDVNNIYILNGIPSKFQPGVTASDHSPFWNAGRSAILMIEEYGNDFNPYYHTGNDIWSTCSGAAHQALFRACVELSTASVAQLAGPLQSTPVELASFNATLRGRQTVHLHWETFSEHNNYGFTVQRRPAGSSTYSDIAFVGGAGTTESMHAYDYEDRVIGEIAFEYRLRQEDLDGQFSYSPVARVLVSEAPHGFALQQNYPNPFTSSTTVTYSLSSGMTVDLVISDALGRKVRTIAEGRREAGVHTLTVLSSGLTPGMYVLTLTTPFGKAVRTIMVNR